MTIVNGYGPTETTVCATLFPFCGATEPDRRTSIGSRIAGYEVYIVDANLQPVPTGIPGEILIGGVGLARGYIHRPKISADHFVPHPFSQGPGARLYKTGDWARYLPDGTLEFLGRRDDQVKIRGYRIELGEIEAALRQHPGVREAVVLVWEDASRDNHRLVAYLVATQEPSPTVSTLRAFLKQRLPAYMIPSTFIVLETLPRTPNGKIDRQVLPIPGPTPSQSASPFVAPAQRQRARSPASGLTCSDSSGLASTTIFSRSGATRSKVCKLLPEPTERGSSSPPNSCSNTQPSLNCPRLWAPSQLSRPNKVW